MNTSLSARVQRRNAVGFKGEGTSSGWKKTTSYGDYKSLEFNNKENDIKNAIAKKNKVGFNKIHFISHPGLTKKYADNHQKVS